jgi:hypothetical protein
MFPNYHLRLANSLSDESQCVPMFVAKHWAEKATNVSEWMALLERNTAPPGNN